MSEQGSLSRAALRVAWAAKAVNVAGDDAKSAGALAAADVLWDEGERLEQLAAEVRKLPTVAGTT